METMVLLSHEPKENTMLSVAGKNFKDMCLLDIAYLPGLPGGRQVEARIAKQGADTVETYLQADFNIKKNLLYDRKEIPEAE